MLKSPSALLFSAALFSTSAHAVIQEQQWHHWFGNISVMEFEINSQNSAGEVLTLTCTGGTLALGRVRISTLRNENETFSQLNSITYIGVFLRLVTYSHLP